jgi:MMP 1-O-methyltransferase
MATSITEVAFKARQLRSMWPSLDSIEGWLLQTEGQWLYDAARRLPKNGNILEIGSYKGRSTCCLALGCFKNGCRVFAVDSFDGGPNLPNVNSYPEFMINLERLSVSEVVQPTADLSVKVAKTWNRPIHFLFIDGSHLYDDVLCDFRSFFPHVVTGGLIAFHDVSNQDWPDVGRAWEELIKHQLKRIGYCESIGFGWKP